ARKLHVLPIITYTPSWARPPGCTSNKCAPADANRFASFAEAAARRYAPLGISAWEIWNEPNVKAFWQPAPDPGRYVDLLRATVRALRGVDPRARVISGGLAASATTEGDISQLDYLADFCTAGGAELVDAVGYHPYSFPVPPDYDASWNAWAQIANTPRSFESILASCGAAHMKLWLTEYGAPTNGPGAGASSEDYK